jgi:hypothetical protein
MRRRELLTGSAALGLSGAAHAFGIGKLGAGMGRLGGLGGKGKGVVIPNQTFNLVTEGNSNTLGVGGTPSYPFVAVAALPGASLTIVTPNAKATTPLAGGSSLTLNDIATSGISALTAAQNYSTRAGASYDATKNINILSVLLGTNTSGTSDTTAIQKYQLVRSYFRSAQATGYNRLVAITMHASGGAASPTFWNTVSVPFNQYLEAYFNNDLDVDYLIDLGASPIFSPASAADNLTYYNSDLIHINVAGAAAAGNIAEPQILSALVGPGVRTLAPMTWSIFDASATLSNGNRTVTVPTGTAQYCTRGFPGVKNGKWNWEINVLGSSSALTVGICNNGFLFNNAHELRNDTNAMGYGSDGGVSYNGTSLGTLPTYTTGDTIQTAYDRDAELIWFRRVRAGVAQSWNANGSANPATGVGGFSTAGVGTGAGTLKIYPACRINSGSDSLQTSFSTSQLANPIPTGFQALDLGTS